MNLLDGLREYQKDPEYWQLTLDLEDSAKEVAALLRHYGREPDAGALEKSRELLVGVERWKAMCIRAQTGFAQRNSQQAIWDALQGALEARTDIEALLSVMKLRGFGASKDPHRGLRRAKRATAVLRFLDPREWGVVDWRTVEVLRLLKSNSWDIDRALAEARREDPRQLRRDLDIINEQWACQVNQRYRVMRSNHLPRAADVDMALFGMSLMAWPIGSVHD